MADRLSLPISCLARLARGNRNTMTSKPDSPAVQAKLGKITRIIAHTAGLAADDGRVIIWLKHQPIPGAGTTPEELVEAGRAELMLEDLEQMAAGTYS